MEKKFSKKRIVFNYLAAIFVAAILWNLIIGNFIVNIGPELESSLANGLAPYSKFLDGREGYTSYYNDNFGYNNDFIPEKTDKFRIIVLGDSKTEANQIARENNYISKLNEKLNSNGDYYEVFNLARSGRLIIDHIGFSEEYQKTLKPDFVIIQGRPKSFTSINSINFFLGENDNQYFLERKEKSKEKYFKLKNIKNTLSSYAPIVGYSLIKIKKSFIKKKISRIQESINSLFREKNKKQNNPPGEINSKLIEWEINQLKARFNDNIVFLNISEAPYINEGKVVFEENSMKHKKAIKNVLNKKGFDFIDTTDSFSKYYLENTVIPLGFNKLGPGTGHPNESGHEIIAEILFNYFKDIKSKVIIK